MTKFRENGAVGALLDEYENAIHGLISVILPISESDLIKVVDSKTNDQNCRSIQSILSHVVQSGYTYAVETLKWHGVKAEYRDSVFYQNVEDYKNALLQMFNFNEQLFKDYPNIKLNEYAQEKKIHVRWGQTFDVEQIYQHAIVHVLRHRRQIEKFKLELEN